MIQIPFRKYYFCRNKNQSILKADLFIAKRIIKGSDSSRFSAPIVNIAVAGISIGVVVMILTIAIVTGFQNEIRDKVIGFSSDIQIRSYDFNDSDEPTPISKIQPFLDSIKNIPEITHIQTYATKNGIIKTKTDNEGVLLKGVDKNYNWKYIQNNLIEGSLPSIADTGISKDILISKIISQRLGLKVKDKLLVYFVTKKRNQNGEYTSEFEQRVKEFYIKGIYETGMEQFDKNWVFVDMKQIQKLNYWQVNEVAGFEVSINDFKKLDAIGEDLYFKVGAGLTAQTAKELYPNIFKWLETQNLNAIIVITLMILVAGINMISALLILILERTNMIGILKALGSNNKNIQKIFVYNAVYLIGKGLLWGNIIGLSICYIQKQFGLIKLDKETYYLSVVPINIDWNYFLLLNLGTIITCTLMMLLPALIISKISPVKAIRYN